MTSAKKAPAMSPTGVAVEAFLETVPDERRRADARELMAIMADITGEPAVMWGPNIVGFGSYHYRYPSGREGDSPVASFSPRKQHLVVYLTSGFEAEYAATLATLGPHTASTACLYLKALDRVNRTALRELIDRSTRVHRDG